MQRIGVLTSGGDAPGMNAAVRAVVRKGFYHGLTVYGIERGFSGLINEEYRVMDRGSVADIIHRGGTILHTARCPEFLISEGQNKALHFIERLKLDGLVVIGGDGSFRGCMALVDAGVPVIGVPATIDNDIAGCEHSIGFDTAVNTVTDAINKVRDTATSHERIYVIEVMGRDTGYIALSAGLAGGAESILIPEIPFDLDDICERLRRGINRGKRHSIILVAEGAASALKIGAEIKSRMEMETRVTILGHIQRGGTPTAFDRMLASRLGAHAVDLLMNKRSGLMVTLNDNNLQDIPFDEVLRGKKELCVELFELAKILAI
ncbi:MAG: 6-phosphofructokinase [Dethiobacteria bacterium]|jgi:6-phosphofructokinase 1|nr:6-phosphofructokinase [Bacillota bacterium]